MTPSKTAQELWMNRVLSGTWTPEHIVPEMKEAERSAAASIASMHSLVSARTTR